MPEVVQSGRMLQPWKIQLACPHCDCIADYDGDDVNLDYVENPTVKCPECGTRNPRMFCTRCMGSHKYECFSGVSEGKNHYTTYPCYCTNLGDKPKWNLSE